MSKVIYFNPSGDSYIEIIFMGKLYGWAKTDDWEAFINENIDSAELLRRTKKSMPQNCMFRMSQQNTYHLN